MLETLVVLFLAPTALFLGIIVPVAVGGVLGAVFKKA